MLDGAFHFVAVLEKVFSLERGTLPVPLTKNNLFSCRQRQNEMHPHQHLQNKSKVNPS